MWLRDRSPGGTFPSPKATDHPHPDRYLRKQWAAAASRPPTFSRRTGLDRLDEYADLVRRTSSLTRSDKAVVLAFTTEARRLGLTTYSIDLRTLAERSGKNKRTVMRVLRHPSVRQFIEALPRCKGGDAASGVARATTYRLRVLEALTELSATVHHTGLTTGGDRTVWGTSDPLDVVAHPLFYDGVGGGVGSAGLQVLLSFATEPRTRTEAQRASVDVSPNTWRKRFPILLQLGLVVEAEPDRYVLGDVTPGNLDRIAEERGLVDVQVRREDRNDEDRIRYAENRRNRGDITPEQCDDVIATIRDNRRKATDAAIDAVLARNIHVDPVTGEITRGRWAIHSRTAISEQSVSVETPGEHPGKPPTETSSAQVWALPTSHDQETPVESRQSHETGPPCPMFSEEIVTAYSDHAVAVLLGCSDVVDLERRLRQRCRSRAPGRSLTAIEHDTSAVQVAS